MPKITIRDVDEETKGRLRVLAAMHGRSMEAEVREILHYHLRDAPRLTAESYPPPAPDRELPVAADHDSDSGDLPLAPRGMDQQEAILLVNRELEKLGMSEFALTRDMLP